MLFPLLLQLLPNVVHTGGPAVAEPVPRCPLLLRHPAAGPSMMLLLPFAAILVVIQRQRSLPERRHCRGGRRRWRRHRPRGKLLLLAQRGIQRAVEDRHSGTMAIAAVGGVGGAAMQLSRRLLLSRHVVFIRAVAEVGGELAHVEEAIVEHHEEEADEEGGEDADQDVGEAPVVGRGLQAQAPQDHQQDVLDEHDAVEGG